MAGMPVRAAGELQCDIRELAPHFVCRRKPSQCLMPRLNR